MLEPVAKIFIEYHERENWLRADVDTVWLKRLEKNLLPIKKLKRGIAKYLSTVF